MPITLVDDPTQFPPVVVPTGGDPRTAEGMQTAAQALADRTANLFNWVTAVGTAPGTSPENAGAKQIQHFATVSLLRAVTAPNRSDGNVALVDGGFGLFQYQANDTTPDDGRYTMQPSDLPAGAAGRWVNVTPGRAIISTVANPVPFGIPITDVTGRLPAALARTYIASDQQFFAGPLNNPGSAFVPITGATCTLAGLVAGDVITFSATWLVQGLASGDQTQFNVNVVDGASGSHPWGQVITLVAADIESGSVKSYKITGFYTVQAGSPGTHTITPQWRVVGGTAGASISAVSCSAEAIRP